MRWTFYSHQSGLCTHFTLSEFLSMSLSPTLSQTHSTHLLLVNLWLHSQLAVCFHNIKSSWEFTSYFLSLSMLLSFYFHCLFSLIITFPPTFSSTHLPWNKWDLCHDNTHIFDHNLHYVDSLVHPLQFSMVLIITYNAFLFCDLQASSPVFSSTERYKLQQKYHASELFIFDVTTILLENEMKLQVRLSPQVCIITVLQSVLYRRLSLKRLQLRYSWRRADQKTVRLLNERQNKNIGVEQTTETRLHSNNKLTEIWTKRKKNTLSLLSFAWPHLLRQTV